MRPRVFASESSADAFAFAICACLVAALTSWSRGHRYVDGEAALAATKEAEPSAQSI